MELDRWENTKDLAQQPIALARFGHFARTLVWGALPTRTIIKASHRALLDAILLLDTDTSPAGLKAELCFPVCFFAQSQIRLEGFSLLGYEAFENAGLAFRAESLDLFQGESLLRNGFVDVEVATLAVAATTVEVLPIGFLDDALLAFRAYERSGRRGCASLCRR